MLYRVVGPKKIMVAGVVTLLTVPGQPAHGTFGAPDNRWAQVGELIELTDEDAAALGARVELVVNE